VPPHSGVAQAGKPSLAVGATLVSRTDEHNDDASAVRVGTRSALRHLLFLQVVAASMPGSSASITSASIMVKNEWMASNERR